MKNIKEKENLIKMSLALGVEPDPKLVAEVAEYREMMKSVKSVGEEFSALLSELGKLKTESNKPKKAVDIPAPPTVDELLELFAEEETKPIAQSEIPLPPTLEELMEEIGIDEEQKVEIEAKADNLIELAAEHIKKEAQFEEKSLFTEQEVPLTQTISELKNKIKYLEQWVSRIAATGPGSGEVNLLKLDDVDVRELADNKYLKYNAANAKIEFATVTSGNDVDLGNISSNIIPTADSTYNLGAPDKRFKTLYLANNTIDLGGSLIRSDGTGQISISGTGAILPGGSRIAVEGQAEKQIALVGDSGTAAISVPFYTQTVGLNRPATNFTFGINPDDYVFSNFTLSTGATLPQARIAQFYF